MPSTTTIYTIIKRNEPKVMYYTSLVPENMDGHDLTEFVEPIEGPYKIEANDCIIIVYKKNTGDICSIMPFFPDSDIHTNDDELAFTTYVEEKSWFGVR